MEAKASKTAPVASGYKVTVADKTDNGSVMDTARPFNPKSPYPQFLTKDTANGYKKSGDME